MGSTTTIAVILAIWALVGAGIYVLTWRRMAGSELPWKIITANLTLVAYNLIFTTAILLYKIV